MDNRIELYRGPERRFIGTVSFTTVVRQSLERIYGWDLSGVRIRVAVANVPEDSTLTGIPAVENLVPDFGFTHVSIRRGNIVLYRHPHPLDEVVTARLQEILRESYPEETTWGFRLDIPGMPPIAASRRAPRVEGGTIVRPYSPGERPSFGIQRLAEPPLPTRRLEDFGLDASTASPSDAVLVLLSPHLERDVLERRAFSEQVEEGGFLVGRVFLCENDPKIHLVEISEALTAARTGASLLHFTFTGDSFAHVKQTLRARPDGERIVGWYHTHLFPATDEMGLSSIDRTLHFSTYTIPWQVAGLVNIDGRHRTLRFYVRDGAEMAQCPYRVSPRRAKATASGAEFGPNSTDPGSGRRRRSIHECG